MMFKTIKWNTGSAAARFRSTRKKIEENRKKNNEIQFKSHQDTLIHTIETLVLDKENIVSRILFETTTKFD